MDAICWRLARKYRSHWIKVTFYQERPDDEDAVRLSDVRFCEATRKAILHPVILDRQSITCPGALYAFGWTQPSQMALPEECYNKRTASQDMFQALISQAPRFNKPFPFIGLNTAGRPDLIMSYLPPDQVMRVIKTYQDRQGVRVDVSLHTLMAICSGIAVKTYLDDDLAISFGCDDSRRYADVGREHLAVGIPKRLLHVFIDD